MGRSGSTHPNVDKRYSVLSSIPPLGEIKNRPLTGAPLVFTTMVDTELLQVSEKVDVDLSGSELGERMRKRVVVDDGVAIKVFDRGPSELDFRSIELSTDQKALHPWGLSDEDEKVTSPLRTTCFAGFTY